MLAHAYMIQGPQQPNPELDVICQLQDLEGIVIHLNLASISSRLDPTVQPALP